MKKIFQKYALQNKSGASLQNAIIQLIAELSNDRERELRSAFMKGANAVINSRWQVSKEEVDGLADEYGY